MQCMADMLTKLALFGAAISFTLYFVLRHARHLVRVLNALVKAPRSHLAAFLFFACVATGVAQKGGTNAPPSGENVELTMENVELRNLPALTENEQIRHSTFYTLNSQLPFRRESVTTNDYYSYAMPTNGTRYARWWKRGAYV